MINTWSEEVAFSDLKRSKSVKDIFVELDTYVHPRRIRIYRDEVVEKINFFQVFNDDAHHYILLGNPGAGKTTTMKFLCNKMIHTELFHDKYRFPLLIRLRELNTRKSQTLSPVIDYIYKTLGLRVDFDVMAKNDQEEMYWQKQKLIISTLNELGVLLVLDGFDEVVGNDLRNSVMVDIRILTEKLLNSKLILTSRTGDFNYVVNGTRQFEICPLSPDQIELFASRWLNNTENAEKFLYQVMASPFADTSIRPLTLAHLCALFERRGEIPDKPKNIYKKIIDLLLDEWDQQRSVKRDSLYANFGTDRKSEFLSNFSFALTTQTKSTSFTEDNLKNAYQHVYRDFGLPKEDAQIVVKELETHTGILLQSGYKDFEFSHKSLQEYLTASYMVRLPSIPTNRLILQNLPNELAIAVAISSVPSDYFVELVFTRFSKGNLSESFIKSFTARLILEKPDFNGSELLSFALISLYSIYISSNIVINGQLSLFNYDNIVAEFELLMQQALRISGIELNSILEKYETVYDFPIENMDDILLEMHSKSRQPIRYKGRVLPSFHPET
jgi:hypothetical protein